MKRKGEEKKLLDLFERLPPAQQEVLIAFGEFLATRPPNADEPGVEPLAIPRPAGETVTMAIRRLVRTYPMLDRRKLMREASQFMAQHALEGRAAVEVIDELESVFARHYEMHKVR
ncbi:MAG: Crp/Fnr family transcriptional regulator [Betaproteobacteria bacterium]|nr:Crp/Fnr family transcriptional regulator [Betaproteobacteria bacterium]